MYESSSSSSATAENAQCWQWWGRPRLWKCQSIMDVLLPKGGASTKSGLKVHYSNLPLITHFSVCSPTFTTFYSILQLPLCKLFRPWSFLLLCSYKESRPLWLCIQTTICMLKLKCLNFILFWILRICLNC